MTTNPELAPDMPEEIYYEPVNGRRPQYGEKVVLCFERTRADLAPQAGSVDVEAIKHELFHAFYEKWNGMGPNAGLNAIIEYLASRNLLAAAPVRGHQELIDALLEAQRKINAAQEHIDELEQKHVMKNDKMFARGLTNDAYNCISHVLIELRKGAESPRPAIPGLQEANAQI